MNVDDILSALDRSTDTPNNEGVIHRDELTALVRRTLGKRWKPQAQPYVFAGDSHYVCLREADLKAFITASLTRQLPYEKQVDCDDFSWRLKLLATEASRAARVRWTYAIGVIWHTTPDYARTGHAYNWAVTADKKFLLIDPQTGNLRPLDETDRNIDLVCC